MDQQKLLDVLKKNYGVYFTAVANKIQELARSLYTHVNFKGNPHGTTANDINLGNVPNYPVATEQEAAEGKSNTALLTPYLATKLVSSQAITAAGIEELVDALTAAFNEATNEIKQS